MPLAKKSKSGSVDFSSLSDDRMLTLPEFAEAAGISIATLRRLIAAQDGPIVTLLSPRRRGIRTQHGREWLDARANPKP
jgi:predicted DNA-binding transcriptional regulator AlpA